MKNILVIGIGRLGSRLAIKLKELGNDVMIVDSDAEIIDKYADRFENSMVADCTNKDVLDTIGVKNFDVIFVSIADNFEASLIITAQLKELGAKYVVSKANKDIQVSILKKIGADEVIDPDYDLADKLAVKYSGKELYDYIELAGSEYDIYEIKPIHNWIGKTILDLKIRARYGINIIGIKEHNSDKLTVNPSPDYKFGDEDHIVIISTKKLLEKLRKEKDEK